MDNNHNHNNHNNITIITTQHHNYPPTPPISSPPSPINFNLQITHNNQYPIISSPTAYPQHQHTNINNFMMSPSTFQPHNGYMDARQGSYYTQRSERGAYYNDGIAVISSIAHEIFSSSMNSLNSIVGVGGGGESSNTNTTSFGQSSISLGGGDNGSMKSTSTIVEENLKKRKGKGGNATTTSEYKFPCPHEGCGKTFNQKYNLKKHQVCHDDDPDSKLHCLRCNKTFKRKYDLQRHKRKIHNEEWFRCLKCDLRFESQAKLKKHLVDIEGCSEFEVDTVVLNSLTQTQFKKV